MVKERLLPGLSVLLLALAFWGCGTSNRDFVATTDGGTQETGILAFNFVLRRADVAPEVQNFQFRTFSDTGNVLFNKRVPKSGQVEIEVPLQSNTCQINYLDGQDKILSTSFVKVRFNGTNRQQVDQPFASPVSTLGQLRDVTVTLTNPQVGIGGEAVFQATANNDAGQIDITDQVTFLSSAPSVLSFDDPNRPNVATVRTQGASSVSAEYTPPTLDLAVMNANADPPVVYFYEQANLNHGAIAALPVNIRPGQRFAMALTNTASGEARFAIAGAGVSNPTVTTYTENGIYNRFPDRTLPLFGGNFQWLGANTLGSIAYLSRDGKDEPQLVGGGLFDFDGTGAAGVLDTETQAVISTDSFRYIGGTFVNTGSGEVDNSAPGDEFVVSRATANGTNYTVYGETQPGDYTVLGSFNQVGIQSGGWGGLVEVGFNSGNFSVARVQNNSATSESSIQILDPTTGQEVKKFVVDSGQDGTTASVGKNNVLFCSTQNGSSDLFVFDATSASGSAPRERIRVTGSEDSGAEVAASKKDPASPRKRSGSVLVQIGQSTTTTTTGGGTSTVGGAGSTGGGTSGGSSGGTGGGTGGTPPPPFEFAIPTRSFPSASPDSIVEPDTTIFENDFIVVGERTSTTDAILAQQNTATFNATSTAAPFSGSAPFEVANGATGGVSSAKVSLDQNEQFSVLYLRSGASFTDVEGRSFNLLANPVPSASANETVFSASAGENCAAPAIDSTVARTGEIFLGALFDSVGGPRVLTAEGDHFGLDPLVQVFNPTEVTSVSNQAFDVSVNANDSFAVSVWVSDIGNVRGRLRIGNNPGTLDSTEFSVHTAVSGVATGVSVDFLSNTEFVVVHDQLAAGQRLLRATRFKIQASNPRIQALNTFLVTSGADDFDPDVAVGTQGQVVWYSWTRETAGSTNVFLQAFTFDGTPLIPGPVQVSGLLDTAGTARNSAVACNDDGDCVVVWDAEESPGVRNVFQRLVNKN